MPFPDDENINDLEKAKFREVSDGIGVAVTGTITSGGGSVTNIIESMPFTTESIDGTTVTEITTITDQIFLRMESEEPDGRWYWGTTSAQATARKHWFTKFRPFAGCVNTSIFVVRASGAAAANLTVWRGTST